jgi:hypothetical protein
MSVGEKTSLPKMLSTRSADVEPGVEPLEEVVTGGETSEAKVTGRHGGRTPVRSDERGKIIDPLELIHTASSL